MANVPAISATTGSNSFAFERVAAILQPFDGFSNFGPYGAQPPTSTTTSAGTPLDPIMQTGGLVFPFNPTISEGIDVSYEPMKMVQSNESYHVYQATENPRISLGDCVWVADTFENARYVLAVLHFFRSYSFMDFGRGRSGKPPSPMWFSAYGNYAYDRVPVLMQKADWTFPSNDEIDYVGVPEPGSAQWNAGQLQFSPSSSPISNITANMVQLSTTIGPSGTSYTWLPVKFKVNSISLIVQHSPRYWIGFNLDDYRSGAMLASRGGFHVELPLQSGPLSAPMQIVTVPNGTAQPGTPAAVAAAPAPGIDLPNVPNGVVTTFDPGVGLL